MYTEIKTDDSTRLLRFFEDVIAEGQPSLLTLGKEGDFYSLSSNTTALQPIEATDEHSGDAQGEPEHT